MRTSSTASLLVAALVMLRRPCARNKATAQLLLERAAEHSELTPAEREACLDLAEDLDIERPEPAVVRTPQPAAPPAVHPQGAGRGPERSRHFESDSRLVLRPRHERCSRMSAATPAVSANTLKALCDAVHKFESRASFQNKSHEIFACA